MVDETVPDFFANEVVFVEGADEKLEDEQGEEVGDRLVEGEAADLVTALISGGPEDINEGEVEEREGGADSEVPPVNETALEADEEDVAVLGEHRRAEGRRAGKMDGRMVGGRKSGDEGLLGL